MSDILSIQNVNIAYGKNPVVKEVSFSVRQGETFGLIGLNGVGKTSLIKAVLGLRPVNSGSIKINGYNPDTKDARASLAYLPERFDPPWFLSGRAFIKFSLNLYKRAFENESIIQFAKRLELDPAALGRRVQTYSKGMRQKLGLMGTVLTNANLLILDEPMSGLDPLARVRVKDVLQECRTSGKTVFLTSHVLVDMDEICDRVAVMHQGQIQFIGTPEELRKKTGAENLERAFLQLIETPFEKRVAA